MAFDRNNPADLLALKNEITLDPLNIGYDSLGNTQVLLNLINLPANNLGAETGPDLVTSEKLLKAIFPINISSQDQFRIQLIFEVGGGLNTSLEGLKSLIGGLSAALQAAIDGIIRPLSRAEVLFSTAETTYESVVITRDDYIAARDS